MKNPNLTTARKNKNLTQDQLATMLREMGMRAVSKQSISNWENGYSTPRLDNALLVAYALEKDVSFLFGSRVQETQTKQEVM